MMGLSKVYGEGQVVIPVGVRRKMGLIKGDLIQFVESETGKICIEKVRVTVEAAET